MKEPTVLNDNQIEHIQAHAVSIAADITRGDSTRTLARQVLDLCHTLQASKTLDEVSDYQQTRRLLGLKVGDTVLDTIKRAATQPQDEVTKVLNYYEVEGAQDFARGTLDFNDCLTPEAIKALSGMLKNLTATIFFMRTCVVEAFPDVIFAGDIFKNFKTIVEESKKTRQQVKDYRRTREQLEVPEGEDLLHAARNLQQMRDAFEAEAEDARKDVAVLASIRRPLCEAAFRTSTGDIIDAVRFVIEKVYDYHQTRQLLQLEETAPLHDFVAMIVEANKKAEDDFKTCHILLDGARVRSGNLVERLERLIKSHADCPLYEFATDIKQTFMKSPKPVEDCEELASIVAQVKEIYTQHEKNARTADVYRQTLRDYLFDILQVVNTTRQKLTDDESIASAYHDVMYEVRRLKENETTAQRTLSEAKLACLKAGMSLPEAVAAVVSSIKHDLTAPAFADFRRNVRSELARIGIMTNPGSTEEDTHVALHDLVSRIVHILSAFGIEEVADIYSKIDDLRFKLHHERGKVSACVQFFCEVLPEDEVNDMAWLTTVDFDHCAKRVKELLQTARGIADEQLRRAEQIEQAFDLMCAALVQVRLLDVRGFQNMPRSTAVQVTLSLDNIRTLKSVLTGAAMLKLVTFAQAQADKK